MNPALRERLKSSPGVSDRYQTEFRMGEGTYGVVYKAIDLRNGTVVAIKTFKAQPGDQRDMEVVSRPAVREIGLLKELEHENIIQLREVLVNPLGGEPLSLVFDFAEYDFHEMIKVHKEHKVFPLEAIKSLMWQLVNGVRYLHAHGVIHRDLKPANVLVMRNGTVKIGDFGMARHYLQPLQPMHKDGNVVTIWYRAPELLFGALHYTTAVDMWAVGCIFAELITSQPLFPSEYTKTEPSFPRDQVDKIFTVMGRLTEARWPLIRHCKHFGELEKFERRFSHTSPRIESHLRHQTERIVPGGLHLDPGLLALLNRLLEYDPAKRITAADILSANDYLKGPPDLGVIFNNPTVAYRGRHATEPRRAQAAAGQKRKNPTAYGRPAKR